MSRGRIIVTGMAVYLPLPGVVFQVLHYMLGLRSLGYEPYYIEDSDRWVYDSTAKDVVEDASANVAIVASVFERHGFGGKWAYHGEWDVNGSYGMDAATILDHYRTADALLNVTGQALTDEQMECRRRIYIESDPFATQVRIAQGDAGETTRLAAHDTHFTFGENIGSADCGIPETSIRWHPTRQPVDLDLWQAPAEIISRKRECFTTISSWLSNVETVQHEGETYHWQKGREFEPFRELPTLCPSCFEIASNGGEYVPESMKQHGWRHVATSDVAGDADSYQRYIWKSRGEFTIAREQYVRPRTGWFSDRSACYLASALPVITQDTGFGRLFPVGRGLFGFTTMDEILAAVDVIASDYAGSCRAAREIAEEYFSAERVVGELMQKAELA